MCRPFCVKLARPEGFESKIVRMVTSGSKRQYILGLMGPFLTLAFYWITSAFDAKRVINALI